MCNDNNNKYIVGDDKYSDDDDDIGNAVVEDTTSAEKDTPFQMTIDLCGHTAKLTKERIGRQLYQII
eukprot:1631678-Ditylum_brightwellii.AAC.1